MDLYQSFGGAEACRWLATVFYGRVSRDPVLAPLFPGSLRCAIEGFTAFLIQFLGGPHEYSDIRWSVSLREMHLRFKIGEQERYAWLRNMAATFEDVGVQEPLRSALFRFFEEASIGIVNQRPDAVHRQIAESGQVHQCLEDIAAAIRAGATTQVMALLESPRMQAGLQSDRKALLGILGMLCERAEPAMLDYVRAKLASDPSLVTERHRRGRILLHDAAAAGSLSIAELLLQMHADPNTTDDAGHAALYHVGNECSAPTGGNVVRALVLAGANPNAADGLKHCTPLHMAARRGSVLVAEALLECGADLEARDSAKDTPLQRAVNCSKPNMVKFLLSRGALIGAVRNRGRNVRIQALLAGS